MRLRSQLILGARLRATTVKRLFSHRWVQVDTALALVPSADLVIHISVHFYQLLTRCVHIDGFLVLHICRP